MTYDPADNPRSLDESLTEEEVREAENTLVEMRRALSHLGSQVGMFNSDGWKVTQSQLYESLQEAVNRICNPETSLEDVPYLRGRITEVQRLMSLGDQVQARKEMLQEEIKNLEEQVETGTHA